MKKLSLKPRQLNSLLKLQLCLWRKTNDKYSRNKGKLI